MRGVCAGMVSCFLLLALGCSQAQPTVNRVQANALDKRIFLDSEWYSQKTVIDTPYHATATFVGEQGPLFKVKWEIQEDYLIARRTHQFVAATENVGVAGEGINQTSPVAMYAIESHFDIRREYNTVTGEELNVVSENTTDRVWYERDFMRVDWSKNLISEEGLQFTTALGGVSFEPVNYYVQEPDHPFAPKFERDASGLLYYIDIVNKYFAKPDTVLTSNYGEIPVCYLVYNQHVDCQPGEIAVRNSFLRVDPNRDYQPMVYSYDHMDRFGYFLTVRDAYDADYGITTDRRLRFVNRHNIWQQSHQRDADGELVACTQATEKEVCGGNGSVCDMALAWAQRTAEGACTIPYRDRQVKPIAFHLSREFPADLIHDAEQMAESWNSAFVDTVGSLRFLECMDEAEAECAPEQEGDPAPCEQEARSECESERERSDGKRVFALCHNPVSEEDDDACGPPGTIAEIGDIRYNLISWVHEPNAASPLGYGPSSADPETGEVISSTANVYGAAVEKHTAWARDVLALIQDDLPEEAMMSNSGYGQWIARFARTGARASEFEADNHVVAVDGRHVERIEQAMGVPQLQELADIQAPAADSAGAEPLLPRLKAIREELLERAGELRMGERAHARLDRLKGTDIEEMMTHEEYVTAAGFDPEAPLSDAVLEAASPLRGQSTERLREVDKLRAQLGSQNNTCLLEGDFVDEGLLGLVRALKRAVEEGDGTLEWYGEAYRIADDEGEIDYALVQQMLRHPVLYSLAMHEVGHTLGLRHNFAGSFDALNYHPRYWELRVQGDGEMQPRAWDPMTQGEIDGRIQEYAYASVMDYTQNAVVADAAGIGHYDRAAVKMGYGDLVEVFTRVPERYLRTIAQVHALQKKGLPRLRLDDRAIVAGPLRTWPYTALPELTGGVEKDEQGNVERFAGLEAREDVRFEILVDNTAVDDAYKLGMRTSAPDGRPAVPYYYCGDEWRDYEPYCMTYDAGADEYEALMSLIDAYWNYYISNNFMRQRVEFDPDDVLQRIYTRYFSKLQSANLYYGFDRSRMAALGADPGFFQRVDGWGAHTLAIGASYQLFSKVVATPAPSAQYGVADANDCHLPATTVDDEVLLVPFRSTDCDTEGVFIDSFDGRPLYSMYSLGPEYSFFYRTRAGYFQDKVLALEMLTNPTSEIVGIDVETELDTRQFYWSYYTTFPDPVSSLLRGVIAEQLSSYAPRWQDDALVFPLPDEQVSGELEGTMVDPNVGFSLQLYAMVYGMALAPSAFDQTLVNKGRLFVRGAAEAVDLELPEGSSLVEFVDEESGLVYMAPSYPDAEGRETGVAASMLLYAQKLKDAEAEVPLRNWIDNLNLMRRLTWLLGFGSDLELEYE